MSELKYIKNELRYESERMQKDWFGKPSLSVGEIFNAIFWDVAPVKTPTLPDYKSMKSSFSKPKVKNLPKEFDKSIKTTIPENLSERIISNELTSILAYGRAPGFSEGFIYNINRRYENNDELKAYISEMRKVNKELKESNKKTFEKLFELKDLI